MALQLGDLAPDFTADSTEGRLSLYDHLGESWGILFSHPADFTPVCTTELGALAALDDDWKSRGVKVLVVSVDSLEDHKAWVADIEAANGTQVSFPLLADPDRAIARLYGMLHPNADSTLTVRSVFVIGPDKRVRLTLTYPASTGRNFDEILRVVDSLQRTDAHKVATPADWTPGDRVVVVPSLSNEEAKKRFGQFEAVTPYLRLTDDPAG